ncbi:MAG: hypothetical protein FWC23_10940 [Chitinispirillia bacterium]|nr:hypothetical protein [Chitinispirillia bacterium]MCL2269683.1 hypothetical protein [Chitinispirillia bacterium]
MENEVAAVQPGGPFGGPAGSQTGKPIPKDLTAMKLLNVTKSFVVVRAIVYAVVTAIMFIGGLISLGICAFIIYTAAKSDGSASGIASIVVFLIVLSTLGAFAGFLRFAKGYCLYMIKAAHIAAITEYLRTGEVPVTDKGYKGVLAFGKEKVGKHFGAANIAFVADKLVAAATRQIMRWANKAMNLLSFIPGSNKIFPIINFILSTAMNFIDEAVLSYVFYRVDEKSSFKKMCDGLVFYAQAWKGMIMGAAKVAVFVWVLRAVCFLINYGIAFAVLAFFAGGLGSLGLLMAIVIATVLTYGLQTVIIEPYATCMMIKDYHATIEGQTLKADMYGTLCGVSKGFKDLFAKSKEEQASIPAAAPAEVAAPAVAAAPVEAKAPAEAAV